MTERGGQKWTLADFRRHVPHIIAEHIRAEARVAELEAALAKAQARAMPEWAEMLTHQSCPKGVHSDWFVDSEHSHRCPWCAIAERDATIKRVRELCAMVGGTAVFVRDVLTALDAAGGSDDGDSP